MTWSHGDFSFAERFQFDLHAPSIFRPAPGVCRSTFHRRVAHHYVGIFLQFLLHHWKGSILGGQDIPRDQTRILLREETLGDNDVQIHAEANGRARKDEHEGLVAQNPAQPASVDGNTPLKYPFARQVEFPVLHVLSDFRNRAHIIGVVLSDTHRETTMATLNVIANSRNSLPMIPPISSRGMNTAISEMLIDNTVNPISRDPFIAAASGDSPSSRYRVMFSITTIASSTTNPVQIARAISERLSRLYSKRYITPNVPMMDSGTAILGMIVAQALRKNMKNNHHHERDRQQQREFDIIDGRPNRCGAIKRRSQA